MCLRLWVLGLGSWGLGLWVWACFRVLGPGFRGVLACLREPCLDLGIWERQSVPLADLFREDYGFCFCAGLRTAESHKKVCA